MGLTFFTLFKFRALNISLWPGLAWLALPPDAAAADGDPGEPEAVAVDLVRGAAVLLDVLVAAVL